MLESQNIKNIYQDIVKNDKKKLIANEIGNKVTDFEILQVLGQGAFGFVAKVRSKKNLKIYAMKKVDLSKVIEDEKKYYENESIFLEKLDHPNICKLFSSFREGTNNYMILEFLDNGDLYSFLNAHMKLKKYIPEEKLWNIFEQCLNGLVYIHSKGVINRDIKPTNILYGSNGECKITDFNISSFTNMEKASKFINDDKKKQEMINQCTDLGSGAFKAPEVLNFDYDEKADVYSLGMTFCSMAYQQMAIPNDEPRLYSKELADIISLMVSEQNYRPSSKNMYNYFIRLYVEKYLHMSSLVSCINCLSCYKSLTDFFKDNDSYIESKKFNKKEKEITKQFNRILKALDEKKNVNIKASILTNPGDEGFNYLLFKLRELLIFYGIEKKNDNSAEIEPIHLINFLLNKLHGELNTKIVNKGIKGNCLKIYVTIPNNIKQQAYDNYMIFYNSNYKSNISDNFFGMIKTKKICLICNKFTYSFNMFSYLPFKIEIMVKAYQGKKNDLNIYDAFDCLNKNYVFLDQKKCVKCRNCNTYTDHNELKQFFNLPKNLIIIFDRGQNYEHNEFIDFPDTLILNHNHVECFINKNDMAYELLGIICRVDAEHQNIKFVSFTKSTNNKYINFEDKKQYNIEDVKNFGVIIGLFYYCSYVEDSPMDNLVMNHLNNNSNNNMNNNNIMLNNNGNNIMLNNNDNNIMPINNDNNIMPNNNNGYCQNNIAQFGPNNNCNNYNNGYCQNNSNINNSNNNNNGYFQNNNFNNNSNNSNNNNNGYFQNNNFNNNSNNSNNNNNGYYQNNNFGPNNNFNNNSNNNNGWCQNNNFNQFGPNNNCNNNNNVNFQNNNFSHIIQNNNFNNNSNNSNNNNNGFCQNNNFNNINNGFNQNNNVQNNNNQNNFNNDYNQNMMLNSNQNMMLNSNQNMMLNSGNQNIMLNNGNQTMMLNVGNQNMNFNNPNANM